MYNCVTRAGRAEPFRSRGADICDASGRRFLKKIYLITPLFVSDRVLYLAYAHPSDGVTSADGVSHVCAHLGFGVASADSPCIYRVRALVPKSGAIGKPP